MQNNKSDYSIQLTEQADTVEGLVKFINSVSLFKVGGMNMRLELSNADLGDIYIGRVYIKWNDSRGADELVLVQETPRYLPPENQIPMSLSEYIETYWEQ